MSARCFTSNAIKTFALEKIVILDGEAPLPATEWQLGLVEPEQYGSISELLENQKDFLVQLGWHIEHGKDQLSLHRKFKTGKPLKGSDVSLIYEEYSYDITASMDDGMPEENPRKRQRPWTVRGKNQDTRTYSHLDKAAEVFMERAKMLAPAAQ